MERTRRQVGSFLSPAPGKQRSIVFLILPWCQDAARPGDSAAEQCFGVGQIAASSPANRSPGISGSSAIRRRQAGSSKCSASAFEVCGSYHDLRSRTHGRASLLAICDFGKVRAFLLIGCRAFAPASRVCCLSLEQNVNWISVLLTLYLHGRIVSPEMAALTHAANRSWILQRSSCLPYCRPRGLPTALILRRGMSCSFSVCEYVYLS